jgi:hypothetical protein
MPNEGKLDDISTRVQASPKKSLRFVALQCGLTKCRVHVNMKLLKLRTYETTVVHRSKNLML